MTAVAAATRNGPIYRNSARAILLALTTQKGDFLYRNAKCVGCALNLLHNPRTVLIEVFQGSMGFMLGVSIQKRQSGCQVLGTLLIILQHLSLQPANFVRCAFQHYMGEQNLVGYRTIHSNHPPIKTKHLLLDVRKHENATVSGPADGILYVLVGVVLL